jgi:transcriptional regulator with XRE-family HTH domain
MPSDLKPRIAAAIRVARTRRGLSQAALAEAVGLSMEAVSHIERGASIPSLETFAELVATLDLDAAKLIGAGKNA